MRKVTDFIKRIVQVPDDAKYAGYHHGWPAWSRRNRSCRSRQPDIFHAEHDSFWNFQRRICFHRTVLGKKRLAKNPPDFGNHAFPCNNYFSSLYFCSCFCARNTDKFLFKRHICHKFRSKIS